MDDLLKEVSVLARARYPILYLVSYEEGRVEKALERLGADLGKQVHCWRASRGFDGPGEGATAKDALRHAIRSSERAIFVFFDLHPWLDDPVTVRLLRDAASALRSSYKTLVLVSPVLRIPPELEKEITVIDVPLPGRPELLGILDRLVRPLVERGQLEIERSVELEEQVVNAALGLTETEASNVFARVIVEDGVFDLDDIPRILDEKRQIIRKTGLLEYFDHSESLANVGGLDRLKAWLSARAGAFSEKAREFGLPEPRGLLLLGVQGCGKSLSAKAIANAWRLPLLRLDVGAVMNAYIGSSEENMRKAIRIAESLSPSILWLDEIEKGFSGMGGGGDSGTGARVFATFLTWLQEKTRPVFVIATANSIERLPPEMLRKGRFDEIFFVDLPSGAERGPIFEIHLRRRGRDPADFDIPALVAASSGMSGAEIEAAVTEALWSAFPEGRDLTTADLDRAIRETVPLSRTMAEPLRAQREWAATRARPAS